MKQNKQAFSLAEVLIAISIIGVVALLTMPKLLNKTDDQEYKSNLKKGYSVLNQAFDLITCENGGYITPSISSCVANNGTGETCFKDALKAKFKYVQECNSGSTLGTCLPAVPRFYTGGADGTNWHMNSYIAGLQLGDGMGLGIHLDDPACATSFGTPAVTNGCGWLTLDLNGIKPPNQWGKDLYSFMVTSDKLLPMRSSYDSTADDCKTGTNQGYYCAYKYLSGN